MMKFPRTSQSRQGRDFRFRTLNALGGGPTPPSRIQWQFVITTARTGLSSSASRAARLSLRSSEFHCLRTSLTTGGEHSIDNRAKVATPAHVTCLIRYVAVAFSGVCFLTISDALSRDSAAFEWTNRIGVLLLLTLTIGYAITDLWALLAGRRSGESWVDRWGPVLISILVPGVLLLKLWDLVLDALWLK